MKNLSSSTEISMVIFAAWLCAEEDESQCAHTQSHYKIRFYFLYASIPASMEWEKRELEFRSIQACTIVHVYC